MITIDSAVNMLLKPLATQYGFKKKRNTYIRVVNDMVQIFNLKKLYGAKCSVEFSCMPLCAGQEVFGGIYDIDMFAPDEEFVYSKFDESSIYELADKIYYLSENYMFPLFKNSADSKSFFDLSVEFETLLSIRNCSDLQSMQADLEYSLSLSLPLHVIALKNHDYEFAMKHVEFQINNYEEALNKPVSYYSESKMQEIRKLYQECCDLREWIKNGDDTQIDALVAENEQISLQAISETFGI